MKDKSSRFRLNCSHWTRGQLISRLNVHILVQSNLTKYEPLYSENVLQNVDVNIYCSIWDVKYNILIYGSTLQRHISNTLVMYSIHVYLYVITGAYWYFKYLPWLRLIYLQCEGMHRGFIGSMYVISFQAHPVKYSCRKRNLLNPTIQATSFISIVLYLIHFPITTLIKNQ
jgi:hypothetical protein